MVEAELDGPPALLEQLLGQPGALLGSGELDQAGVGRDFLFATAPQLIQRLLGGPPDEVPQRDVQAGAAAIGGAGRVVAQTRGVRLGVEGILAEQLGFDGREQAGVHTRTDAHQALVAVHLEERAAAHLETHLAARIPGRLQGAHRPDGSQRNHADIRDLEPQRAPRSLGRQAGCGGQRPEPGQELPALHTQRQYHSAASRNPMLLSAARVRRRVG